MNNVGDEIMASSGGTVHEQLQHNISQLQTIFTLAPDLVIRSMDTEQGASAVVAYFEGLVDMNSINNDVLRPFFHSIHNQEGVVPVTVGNIKNTTKWSEIEHGLLIGKSVVFMEGQAKAFLLDTSGWPQRAIEDPQIEASIKGAHQGFVETAQLNIALIRRYIPNRELKITELTVGARGKTSISIMYLQDVADPEILTELVERIGKVDVDAIINTGELAEFVEDRSFSPFPQLLMTERPDSAASHILQGRFVIVVDRSPSVLIAPVTFVAFFQSVDDYSMRWSIATFIRLLRMFAFMIALFLPSIYISFLTFNFEVIPIQLVLSIAESREKVPFHPFLEAVMMEITLEMMREAGIRLPAPIGQTVGLVGGIIIGQTAVQAGIVSNIMVIVVSVTAIASFIIPNYDMGAAIRFLRFPMMLLAFMFGIVGLVSGAMMLVSHITALTSLGAPYGSPLSPLKFSDLKDAFVRLPLWKMSSRPTNAMPKQSKRQGNNKPDGDAS